MDFENFKNELCTKLEKIELSGEQIKSFYIYMQLLIEWNEKINLTAITKPEEIILKHFVDSILVLNNIDINNGASLIDVGTGAGFPGIPLKIVRPDLQITLVDSLNKRILFLNEVIDKLNLKNIKSIHGRAEEIGRNKEYREKFDYTVSRAVANLSVLLEYMLPLTKIEGKVICMKGSNIEEEFQNSKNAIKTLGGKFVEIRKYNLPKTDIKRNIVIIEKNTITPNKYPRKPGTPVKNPII